MSSSDDISRITITSKAKPFPKASFNPCQQAQLWSRRKLYWSIALGDCTQSLCAISTCSALSGAVLQCISGALRGTGTASSILWPSSSQSSINKPTPSPNMILPAPQQKHLITSVPSWQDKRISLSPETATHVINVTQQVVS